MGVQLTGYALPPTTNPSLFEEADIAMGMISITGDICDLAYLTKSVQNSKPEIIFHLAAQPLVRYSYENPVETYSTNVMGLVNLLEAVRNTPEVKSVVIVTTDKCYENREWVWPYRENEAMGGHDPYSSSKGCAELVVAAYRSSYFNPFEYKQHGVGIATARAGNVIGGGDWSKDRLIPDILNTIHMDAPVQLRNPNAIRPWQHVLEPLRGYITLAEKLYGDGQKFSEAWNFGPEMMDCISVLDIAKGLISISGANSDIEVIDNVGQPHEAGLLKLDISKARSNLLWYPNISIKEALGLVWSWEEARLSGADMRMTTKSQISNYQSIINQ